MDMWIVRTIGFLDKNRSIDGLQHRKIIETVSEADRNNFPAF